MSLFATTPAYPIGFVAVLLLLAAGCTASTSNDKNAKNVVPETTAGNALLQADEVLHQRLQVVQEADNAYNQLLTGATTTTALDEGEGRIIQAEMALQQSIDSLEQQAKETTAKERLLHLTAYFKQALHSRRALSELRMAFSTDTDDSATTQRTLMQLQAELREKQKQIAALERANNEKATPETTVTGGERGTPAPAKGETPADLKQRNKNLALALNNMQVKYFALGRDYLVLKQQHERTVAELTALRKNGAQN